MNTKLQITIKPQKSILDKIELAEPIDDNILNQLINSTLLLQTFNNPCCKMYENEKAQLIKYRQKIRDGYAMIQYKRSSKSKYGRVFPKYSLGLISIRRQIRHTLAKNTMIDIDVENAHPVILVQLCEANNIKCKYLKKYVMNRETYLAEVMETYSCTRDRAKNLFLCSLFGSSFKSWIDGEALEQTPFVKKYFNEVKEISTCIMLANPELVKEVEAKKDYNVTGSVLSVFLQEYENRILEVAVSYCMANGYINDNIASLCFDGFMMLIKDYKPELLQEIMDEVYDKMGFKLKFLAKKMDEDYLEELKSGKCVAAAGDRTLDTQYEKTRTEFEMHNFKLNNPISFVEEVDGQVVFRPKQKFFDRYQNIRTMNDKGKDVAFLDEWFKDSNMRTYKKIDFLPKLVAPFDVYNTFTSFAAEGKPSQNMDFKKSLIHEHILNLCGRDTNVFDYFIKFLALKVQTPSELTRTSLIFSSIPGCGKDLFFNWFGTAILGKKYYFNCDKPDSVFKDFNTIIENKLLMVLNETKGTDSKKFIELIKNMITREHLVIEPKGMDSYEVSNFISLIFLSNNEYPVPIELNDRRFTAIQCNGEIANKTTYFEPLIKQLNGSEYDRCFYDYLMSIDIQGYDFTNNRPVTAYYKQLQEINIPIVARFLDDMQRSKKCVFQSAELFQCFNSFLVNGNYKYETNITKFGLDLKKYSGIEKGRNKSGVCYSFDFKVLKAYLVEKGFTENLQFIDVEPADKEDEEDLTDEDDDVSVVSPLDYM